MTDVLSTDELATAMASLTGWSGTTTQIERTVTAPDFPTAIRVVSDVADVAEQANHHPDIDIRWRRVRFALSTHDAGGLTTLDIDLAGQIDAVAVAHGAE